MEKTTFPILDSLPEFLKSNDLVQLGLYPSNDAVYLARIRGQGPDFIRFKRKVLYPKTSVFTFIERHFYKGKATPEGGENL